MRARRKSHALRLSLAFVAGLFAGHWTSHAPECRPNERLTMMAPDVARCMPIEAGKEQP
jgi:hypothetical protein